MYETYSKLLQIMLPSERLLFWKTVLAFLVFSVFESVSAISLLPFLHLLANPELVETNKYVSWWYVNLEFESIKSFMWWTGILVLIITLLGVSFKMINIWIGTRFALGRSYSISSRLLSKYLEQPYEWFLQKNTTDLNRQVLTEVNRVVSETLLPAMRLIPEAITVVVLVGVLVVREPMIAFLTSGVLVSAYGLIFVSVRNRLGRNGKSQFASNRDRFRVLSDATGGLKELKFLGLEDTYLARFKNATFQLVRNQIESQVIMNVPRQAVEAIALGGVILLILTMINKDGADLSQIITKLGLVAIIGLKLIPSLQTIYLRTSTIKQSKPSLDQVYADIIGLKSNENVKQSPKEQKRLELKKSLVLESASYRYPVSEKPALYNVTCTIKVNQTVAFVGGTGAGKTTLVDIILGLLRPTNGHLIVDDERITSMNLRAWQNSIGYVPQSIFLTSGTVAENIAFGVEPTKIDMEKVKIAARTAVLHDFIMEELHEGYQTSLGDRGVRLSGGQKQRIGIARALYFDPKIILFDEATSALDNVTESYVIESVQKLAGTKTIIMIAHRLSSVRNCDKIFVMHGGQIKAEGTFDELLVENQDFRALAKDYLQNEKTTNF